MKRNQMWLMGFFIGFSGLILLGKSEVSLYDIIAEFKQIQKQHEIASAQCNVKLNEATLKSLPTYEQQIEYMLDFFYSPCFVEISNRTYQLEMNVVDKMRNHDEINKHFTWTEESILNSVAMRLYISLQRNTSIKLERRNLAKEYIKNFGVDKNIFYSENFDEGACFWNCFDDINWKNNHTSVKDILDSFDEAQRVVKNNWDQIKKSLN
ncbi:MAG: hypothetical protein ACXWL2_04840 [Candidatus Chromulinivorax sp.]